jgi:hypothetical protein
MIHIMIIVVFVVVVAEASALMTRSDICKIASNKKI